MQLQTPRTLGQAIEHDRGGRSPRIPGEAIVKTLGPLDTVALEAQVAPLGFEVARQFDLSDEQRERLGGDLYLVRAKDVATDEALARLTSARGIAYAAPNDRLQCEAEPTLCATDAPAPDLATPAPSAQPRVPDDLDSRLWGLANRSRPGADVHALDAWNITTGRREGGPVVAVLDSGIDYRHPDLAANMWVNPDPKAPDRHGYSFIDNTPDPIDQNMHGTHVAGTIAAVGNNAQGVVGVNWEGRLMAVKFMDAEGRGTVAGAIDGMLYADRHGARVVNASWGGPGFNQAVYDVIKSSRALYIVAAGNSSTDSDQQPVYPAAYDLPNIISVAASSPSDGRHRTSNFGRATVDVAAPGEDILSTVPNGGYETLSGTSMAAPHVAGAAALLLSRFPDLTNAQVKDRIVYGSDRVDAWQGLTVSEGRLDVHRALDDDTAAPAALGALRADAVGLASTVLSFTATGDDGAKGTAAAYDLRIADRPIAVGAPRAGEVAFEAAPRFSTPAPSAAGSTERVIVRFPPSEAQRTLYAALRVYDNVGNVAPTAFATVKVPAAKASFSDREASAPGWQADAPWQPQRDASRGRVWAALSDELLPNGLDASLTTPPLDLTGARSALLEFALSHSLDRRHDFLLVETSADGGQRWTERARYTDRGDWSTQRLDISDLAGTRGLVRFRVVTDDKVRSRGAAIDDIVVWTALAQGDAEHVSPIARTPRALVRDADERGREGAG